MISVEFALFNLTGLDHKFVVTSPDPDAFIVEYQALLRKLEDQGFDEKIPDPSLAPRYEHIIGWVLGEANTNKPG